VDYSGGYSMKAAPQVYAPPVGVTAPCVIGASLGVSGMGWGFAGGTGVADAGCERRASAVVMHSWGHVDAAKEMLCADVAVAAAYERAGQPCKKPVVATPTVVTQQESPATCYRDPLVAKRAGVPVCK
jgi:hypothetical protein